MCRYLPSTIQRYLDLPSTQRIQTHTSHRHNTTPPLPTLVQAPYTTQPKHRHMSNILPVPTGLVKPKPNSLIHFAVTLAPSQHTHMQHKQQYMHHSHHNNRIHNIGYYDNLTNRPRTTTGLPTPHKPSSKSERNLIILQVNINGLRNKLEELKLLISRHTCRHHHNSGTKLTPKAKTPKIHNFTAVRTYRLHKAGGGLITLIRDYIHNNRHTLRLLIHTTQNFKWLRYT